MSENKITAVHAGTGVWDFTCHAHDGEPMVLRTVSSPKHAVKVMQDHADKEHPGVRMRLSRDSEWSGSLRTTYTSKGQGK
jgi:hypothetical protein